MGSARFARLGGVLFVLSAQAVLAQRLLIEAPGLTASLDRAYRCGSAVAVRIEVDRPERFAAGSPQLQSVVDAVHAVLAYECPHLSELRISGQLKGLGQEIYRAVSTRSAGWLIEPLETVRTEATDVADGLAKEDGRSAGADPELTVARLARGMSVPAAQAAVRETFGAEVRYDRERQLLTLRGEGCPETYEWTPSARTPEPGWKCLRAWFTRGAEPRLYRLLLVQVVEGAEPAEVERALVARYGEPRQRWLSAREGRWFAADRELTHLAWGRPLERSGPSDGEAGRSPAYELQASVEGVAGSVVATVILSDPSRKPAGGPGIDLTL